MIGESLDNIENLDPNARWEWVKFTIKSKSIQFVQALNKERKRHEHSLEEKYKELSIGMDDGHTDLEEELNSV